MKWAMTTVSFRFHLHSFTEIMRFAADAGFLAVELWEPHWIRNGREIMDYWRSRPPQAIPICALSAYQDLTDIQQPVELWNKQLLDKLENCRKLQIPVLRLFTGELSSALATKGVWLEWLDRLETLERMAAEMKVQIAFETHPGTLLDHTHAVDYFADEIWKRGWTQIGLNFDVYHVWEFGADPLAYAKKWFPVIKHIHLKNAKQRTPQFSFANVYHPMGRFDDLTELSSGAIDVRRIVRYMEEHGYIGAATLEWFGYPSMEHFRKELDNLRQIQLVEKGGAL